MLANKFCISYNIFSSPKQKQKGMDKIGEVGATVAGVATPASMLDATLTGVSKAASQLGVHVGMLGRDALEIMRTRASKL